MKKIILIFVSLVLIQSTLADSFIDLQVIPYDSANAENMKIWFPVKSKSCQVNIRILDSKMKQVRLLLHKKLKYNFYNIYWDKKDDSGNFVAEGSYKVGIMSCDYKRIVPIHVNYSNGENAALVSVGTDINNPSLVLTLLKDSLYVSLEIINRRKIHTATLFTDSLIVQKNVSLNWKPDSVVPSGKYFYKLKFNDFTQLIPFRYKK